MLVKHSPASIVHQLATKEAKSPQTLLALIAKMRAQMALDVAKDAPEAPHTDIEAAEHLLDKKA